MIEKEWGRNKLFSQVKENFSVKVRAMRIDWMFVGDKQYAE